MLLKVYEELRGLGRLDFEIQDIEYFYKKCPTFQLILLESDFVSFFRLLKLWKIGRQCVRDFA
jgi:hypothetical protein